MAFANKEWECVPEKIPCEMFVEYRTEESVHECHSNFSGMSEKNTYNFPTFN